MFRPGVNRTRKGEFVLDSQDAEACVADFKAHGADLMVDWEHLSLDDEAPVEDRRAAGWAQLEMRQDGSLWAVDVRWTQEAKAAIEAKEFRYTSPAFSSDEQSPPHIRTILNCALCNLPATDDLPPLIAASTTADLPAPSLEKNRMDLAAIAKALGLPEGATAEDIVKKIAEMQGGAPDPQQASAAPAAEPGTEDVAALGQILSLSGKSSFREAARHFAALTVGSETADTVRELKNKLAAREYGDALSAAERDGRVTPANKATVITASGGKFKTGEKGRIELTAAGDNGTLATVLSVLTPHKGIAASAGVARPTATALTSDKRFEDYSSAELYKLSQEEPETYAALRDDRNARRAARSRR